VVRGDAGRPFSDEGDSGAIVVNSRNAIVGLIRASSGSYSVITPWALVEQSCDVRFEMDTR
jgi:hypothetical protein